MAQAHYGALRLPVPARRDWSSTDNALEELAFAAKDMLVVVDDFEPRGGPTRCSRTTARPTACSGRSATTPGRQRLDA